MSSAPTTALVVKMTAKPETRDEVAQFLTGALELADAEAGTTVWFALRTDASTFWIVDAFPGAGERQVGKLATSAGPLPPTGRVVDLRVIDVLTITEGRISAIWMVADELAALAAGGAVRLSPDGSPQSSPRATAGES
jgi:hypothetical protein